MIGDMVGLPILAGFFILVLASCFALLFLLYFLYKKIKKRDDTK
jgi:hypothetical protein